MKIYYFVDHTSQYAGNSGVQRVVRGLARALLEAGCDLVFIGWCSRLKALVPIDKEMLKNLARFQGPTLSEQMFNMYPVNFNYTTPLHESAFAPNGKTWLLVPEVTHITFHAMPPTQLILDYSGKVGLRTAFIFYDAIPLKHSDYAETETKHSEYMQQLALADLIIPISRFAANDLVSFFLNRLYFQADTLPDINPLLLPAEVLSRERHIPFDAVNPAKLLLSVGTIEPRKNQLSLLHAFQKFCDKYPESEAQLVLIGGLNPIGASDIMLAVWKNPRVKHIEFADDQELNEYYTKCDFTVFPSIEEGYGLPIVESLWFGKPCICANFGSMAEIAEGGGCFTVDTRQVGELYSAISKLLLQPASLTVLKEEIRNRQFTTWAEYGEQIIKLIRSTDAPSMHIRKIYYWIDHTCTYPSNSGIQRVVRGLAASLHNTAVPIVPVGWDSKQEKLIRPNESELAHLEKWNGPEFENWSPGLPNVNESGAWLLVPELLTYPGAPDILSVNAYAKKMNLRTAIIFFDAIPYKLTEFSTYDAQQAHAEYMRMLSHFDQVLCISEQSKSDLLSYLRVHLDRLTNVEQRVKTVYLPAEFSEAERQTESKQAKKEGPVTILSVGTLEARKNHISLLKAFKQAKLLTKVSLKLVLAGHAPFPDIEKTVTEYTESDADITWIDCPDDTRLGDLYRDCDFTVYPSLEEGFGLPILESLWYARPCICRNASSMREIGEGGGCILVETAAPAELANTIVQLAENPTLLLKLSEDATRRTFKTWNEYGQDILKELASVSDWHARAYPLENVAPSRSAFHAPILSVCISTYNRAAWLNLSLPLLIKQTAPYRDVLEVLVCDNASTDNTQKIVEPYLQEPGFRYIKNIENVGMLGNLKVTAQHAIGQYVWILGDDDLLLHGTIERVMKAILEHPDVSLVYLNYAYTNIADAEQVDDIEQFLTSGIPIRPPCPDLFAPISVLSTISENFFTAIYCLVFRRDHALRVYSQNTHGRPFSSMLTSIPTSHYVCNHMMKEAGYWIGVPGLIVNMNVSWGKYAPLWILERLPELYDLAESKNASPSEVDRWRKHNLPGALKYLRQIYYSDVENNIQYFSIERFLARHKHLLKSKKELEIFMSVYEEAYNKGHFSAYIKPKELLNRFGLSLG